jgi:two-component system, NarL family, sensor kinase
MQQDFSRDISIESVKQLILLGTFVFLLLGIFILMILVVYRSRRNKMLIEKKEMESQFSQSLLQSQLEIHEQTLKTISQEIHDNVGQVLTLAKLNLSTTAIADEAAAEKIKTSHQLISKAIQDLRDLSRSLNTDYVEEMGLIRSIEYELDMLKKTETIETSFAIEGKTVRLDKQKELILFRIVQEAIHNTIKHAAATNLAVDVYFNDHNMMIKVKDNGKGFDLSPLNNTADTSFGLGLKNMNNRATLIGAKFLMESQTGQGTMVTIELPFNHHTNETTAKN